MKKAALWTVVLLVAAAGMFSVRSHLGQGHVALVFLLIVLGGSASGGRPVGLWLSAASFLCFDLLFLPPYGKLVVANPLDWLVLVAYLVTSVVAAQLLYNAQEHARIADERAAEVKRLAAEAEHAEALREADRLKDALIASVSHDLRTPLTTIKALAHDLAETGDERTEIIEQEADRLNRMVADLLDLSRLSAGALPMHVELNAVDDLIGALVQQVEPALGGRRLEVALPPGEPLLLGRFDLVHSLRILANLVANAAKHAPGDTPIEITVAEEEGTIAISVADRGPGIPAAEADRIFEPFYRPAGVPPDVGGAGLGLSIARQLAEAQRGQVTYRGRAGGGSVFTLRLPAAEHPALPPREAAARQS